MCTVTLVPLENNDFVLISNRDEAPSRISIAPECYKYNNTQLLYPKDVDSGGTWIGLSDQKRLICLLNGGFEIHERQQKYRKSRGVVVKDFLSCNDLNEVFQKYNLMDIEPFTMILVDWNKELKFYELVWDSKQRHFQILKNEPHIWSSSTLYNQDMRKERQQWFQEFIKNNKLNPVSLYKFHQLAGKGNADYGVIMDRGFVKTTSITQVKKNNDTVEMRYVDLSTNNHAIKFLNQAFVD